MSAEQESFHSVEMKALKVGMYSAVLMAAVGLGFAYLTNSQAILLDGMFNLLLAVAVAISISVSRRINQGPNETYHYGYGGFEPFIVLIRSGVGIALMAYSSIIAIQTMLQGGSKVNGGLALVYSIVLAIACTGISLYMYRAYKLTGWATMKAEFITWVMNGAISSTSGVALFASQFLEGTSAEWLMPHADSIVVLLMQLVLLPPPLKMLKQSGLELLGRAPDTELESQKAFRGALPTEFKVQVERVVQTGRTEFVMFEVTAPPETTVKQCDEVRAIWDGMIKDRFPTTHAILIVSNLL